MANNQSAIVKLTMSRSMCYGPCPAYTMTLNAEGLVLYEGKAFVIKEGHHSWTISAPRLRALGKLIEASRIFTASRPTGQNVTCVATIDLRIELADGRCRVLEEVYDWSVVDDLVDRIDKYCGIFDYAYRPLVMYRATVVAGWQVFNRTVCALGPSHARELLEMFVVNDGEETERTVPIDDWTLKRLCWSKDAYPACQGSVDGIWSPDT